MSFKTILVAIFSATILLSASACKNNKIPCPTYADSMPEKKSKKKKKPEPQIPKASKPKSGVLPPGYGK